MTTRRKTTTTQAKSSSDKDSLLDHYRMMQLIRFFEEKSGEMYMLGKIRGFLHLYIGQEAVAVGAVASMEPQDYIVTGYRDHGHALARGMSPNAVMAELFGRDTGTSHGLGGSMHLVDASRNFCGGYAIVGGQLPMSLGLAMASQQLKENRVVFVFLGDGAVNQGTFHETMNMASLWKLPVVFFVENNLYGMGSHIDRTHAGGRDIYKVADHYRVASRQVDGMNVLEVEAAVREVAERVRGGGGPFLLEALTYRFRGHSLADPEEYRDKAADEPWKARDPITTFRSYLVNSAMASAGELDQIDIAAEAEVEEAVKFAEESPEPSPEVMYNNIYAG
jgi:pyruvate dehydrogenase E1 component alpha subunit